MIDLFSLSFEMLTQSGIPIILAISILIILSAVIIGAKHYRKNYINRLFHKRNLCWFLAWLVSLAVMLSFYFFHIFSLCPLSLSITIFVVYILFGISVFYSVSGLVFFSDWYIKKYKRLKSRGYVAENKKVIDHRPWFIMDANERIQYELLKASYLRELGDIKSAYESLCVAETMPMYDEEISECDISRVYVLIELGNIKKARQILETIKTYDYTAFCFLDSFISEMEGNLDEAFEKAQTAESSIDDKKYKNTRVKQALYNHLGRLYCFKNNPTEVFRYYRLSIEEAKKLNDASMLNITYNNLIEQYLKHNKSKTEILVLFNEYKDQIDRDSLNAVCQLINLRVRIAQHFNDKVDEENVLRQGYERIKKKSKYPQLAGQRVQIMHMLHNGGFDLEPTLSDIENDFSVYDKLPLPQKTHIFIDLARFSIRPDVDYERFERIRQDSFSYLGNKAINDIDKYYQNLSGNCVNERCAILENKVDVYSLLDINDNQQYQLLHDVKQIYHDNELMLSEARTNLNIVKHYANQCEKGKDLTDESIDDINRLMDEAIRLSYSIPWPLLGNLLIDIASAYDYFGVSDMVCSILKHFKSLNLTSDYCDDYRQHSLDYLLSKYHLK